MCLCTDVSKRNLKKGNGSRWWKQTIVFVSFNLPTPPIEWHMKLSEMTGRCLSHLTKKESARRLGTKPKGKRHPECVCSVREAERVRAKSFVSCKTELKAADELLGWCWLVGVCSSFRSLFFLLWKTTSSRSDELAVLSFVRLVCYSSRNQSTHLFPSRQEHLESSTIQTKTTS